MKKICFLLGGFTGNGGIGRVTSILANNLTNYNEYEIHTLSFYKTNKENLYYLDKKVKQDFLFNKPLNMTKGILKNGIGKLRRYLKANDIDILIACGALYYPIAAFACINSKVKYICWEHSNVQNDKDHKFQIFSRYIGAKMANKVITLTNYDKNSYIKKYKIKNVKRIYNPIDNEVFKHKKVYKNNSNKILAVGRLTYQKNFDDLIEIAKIITEKYPSWKFDIYGEGELRESLQKKIYEYKLSENISLKGQVKNLYSLYNNYSMLVMTSRYEGFPMTLLEAMANGIPLISYDVLTGPNEIITDGENGYLVKAFDINKMVEKIISLIDDENKRKLLSDNCLLKCELYTLENIINEWRNVFESI